MFICRLYNGIVARCCRRGRRPSDRQTDRPTEQTDRQLEELSASHPFFRSSELRATPSLRHFSGAASSGSLSLVRSAFMLSAVFLFLCCKLACVCAFSVRCITTTANAGFSRTRDGELSVFGVHAYLCLVYMFCANGKHAFCIASFCDKLCFWFSLIRGAYFSRNIYYCTCAMLIVIGASIFRIVLNRTHIENMKTSRHIGNFIHQPHR